MATNRRRDNATDSDQTIDAKLDRRISPHVPKFKEYMKTDRYKTDMNDREERERFYGEILGKERLENLNEFEFGTIVSRLWASQVWGNKDYLPFIPCPRSIS